MASQSRTIKVRFDGDADGLAKATTKGAKSVKKLQKDLEGIGKVSGKGFSTSLGSAMKMGLSATVPSFLKSFGSMLSSGLKNVLAAPIIGPIISVALVGAFAAVASTLAPVAASLIGGAIVLGVGAGLVGLGVMLLLQDAKIRKQFDATGASIKKSLTDAARPLQPILESALKSADKLVKSFAPVLKTAFKDAQYSLDKFTQQAINAFKGLKPAIQPLMSAFTDILDIIGPQLKGIFKDIGVALKGMANVVSENRTVIATIFTALIKTIPAVISGIAAVASAMGEFISIGYKVANVVTDAFVSVSNAVLDAAEQVLLVIRSIAVAIGKLPGMEEWSQGFVTSMDEAIGSVQKWKVEAQTLGREVKLNANILDLQQKIDEALTELDNPNITRERRAQLNADITKLQIAKAKAVVDLGDPKLVKEYRSSMTTSISDLQSRLKVARKELADPNLTKERKSKLNADIKSLKTQVSAAKAALASIKNKTVSVFVKTEYQDSLSRNALRQASARADGGPVRSGRTYLVGEEGPELLTMGATSGNITPNHKINKRDVDDLSTVSANHSVGGELPSVDVRVFIGDRELTDIVRVEMSERDRNTKRRALAGVAR